nr:MAG TPA: hypothetical protein [Caudoviricetes sp.]
MSKKKRRYKSKLEIANQYLNVWHYKGKLTEEEITDTVLYGYSSFERMKTDPNPQSMYDMITFYNITCIIQEMGYDAIPAEHVDTIYSELIAMRERYRSTKALALSGELVRLFPYVLEAHAKQVSKASRSELLKALEMHKNA